MKKLTKTLLIVCTLLCLPLLGIVPVSAHAQNKPTIKIGYVQKWPSSKITTRLASSVIREKLGYPVKLVSTTPGLMFLGVGHNHLDAMLSAWLPVDHKEYYLKVWQNVINLGPNLIGTNLGLVVPKYVPINNITQLNHYAAKFNHTIVGAGAGGGIALDTKKAIKAYNLKFHLQNSSTAAMAASLARHIKQHKWVVITGWSPLWIWGRFNIKFLKDPKKIYGHHGYIATLTTRKLPEKAPAVFSFLRRFRITLAQLNNLEAKVKSGESVQNAISTWITAHPKLVASWTTGVTTSSSTNG